VDLQGKEAGGWSGRAPYRTRATSRTCSDERRQGPDDGYFSPHLAGHLAAADRRDELAGLLIGVEWMRSRLRVGGGFGKEGEERTVYDVAADGTGASEGARMGQSLAACR